VLHARHAKAGATASVPRPFKPIGLLGRNRHVAPVDDPLCDRIKRGDRVIDAPDDGAKMGVVAKFRERRGPC
jgi:hypothetical protein